MIAIMQNRPGLEVSVDGKELKTGINGLTVKKTPESREKLKP